MPQYRYKPSVQVEAFRLGQKGQPTPAPEWFQPHPSSIHDNGIWVPLLGYEESVIAEWGQWIVKDQVGNLSVWTNEAFKETFDLVQA